MLVHNWRAVLRRAWSVRLVALGLLFIVVEPVTNVVAASWVSGNLYIQLAMSTASGLFAAATIIARIFVQQQISGDLNGKPPAEG
ncbi:DUF7940 domain-containing protein [Rhizobium ruizarguesonis]|jgi:hypothetical protein|uniref:DUF7940 domain-containing protein n=1 Tax=Rhizobium ruizarguesonis TaxID=2081791 RepID=UPI00102F863D|nr:hypothetical protein [Rhizobium ruizarguesonis]MBY5852505.1 hypothetical protein [Rhizobium leguminosarum]TAT77579.1 hypothetical protein ELI56_04905 [Rhizobium ruizarguesonis]TAT89328.1 hypothetical protein ELI54_14465 [Rhizobium ruizarguesonis]TAY78308.1 hypothetical protein ELH86_04700 [Rhizobium ruizarguesonis]TAZ33821.1 hypothetical protein ELH80_04910 [Rhizobium ruizarguesonis]